jgi:hypothetical protein
VAGQPPVAGTGNRGRLQHMPPSATSSRKTAVPGPAAYRATHTLLPGRLLLRRPDEGGRGALAAYRCRRRALRGRDRATSHEPVLQPVRLSVIRIESWAGSETRMTVGQGGDIARTLYSHAAITESSTHPPTRGMPWAHRRDRERSGVFIGRALRSFHATTVEVTHG